MPWARIAENALDHPKILEIVDCRHPFDLWVWGLAYAQKHLTDGYLPAVAIPRGATAAAARLVQLDLWTRDDRDYRIHDFHDWNDSRETVLTKRAGTRARVQRLRARTETRTRDPVTRNNGDLVTRNSGRVTNATCVVGGVRTSTKTTNDPGTDRNGSATVADLNLRAGALLEDYRALYSKHRHGAKLPLVASPADFAKAIEMCGLWDDARLLKLVEVFLTSDDPWIAGTDRKFSVFCIKASWCDDRLAAWEAARKQA